METQICASGVTGVYFRELQHVGHVGEQKINCRPIKALEIARIRLQDEPYALLTITHRKFTMLLGNTLFRGTLPRAVV